MVVREQGPGEARDWRARAACRGMDGEAFFPTAEAGPELERAESEAKRVCTGCRVRAQCLSWAMETLPFGVAGGLGEAERAALRRSSRPEHRRRRLPAAPPEPVRGRGGRVSEQRDAGTAALARGRDRDEVARECGVSRRTVDRWALTLRDVSAQSPGTAGAAAPGTTRSGDDSRVAACPRRVATTGIRSSRTGAGVEL